MAYACIEQRGILLCDGSASVRSYIVGCQLAVAAGIDCDAGFPVELRLCCKGYGKHGHQCE